MQIAFQILQGYQKMKKIFEKDFWIIFMHPVEAFNLHLSQFQDVLKYVTAKQLFLSKSHCHNVEKSSIFANIQFPQTTM